MSDETKQLNKARQALVDRMYARLNAGELLWFNGMKDVTMPYNATSKTRYRGMNAINLMFAAYERGIIDPRWITFNQATDAGYKVKKGAKGVPIELYKIIDKRTGKDADLSTIKEETQGMTFEERQAFKRETLQTFARTYYVFNASDVAGIEPYRAPELTAADIATRNERIERVIANSQAPILYDGNGRNFYNHSSDEIHLTDRAAFTSDEFFYNTALHEMAHSTGHSSRLKRDMNGGYGSKSYAREELVAEMASVLIAAELGLNLSDRVIENSAEYVRSWAQLIRDNPQALIDAAFDASKATDYVCDSAHQRDQAQEKTQKESLQSSDNGSPMRAIFTFHSDGINPSIIAGFARDRGMTTAVFRNTDGNGRFENLEFGKTPLNEDVWLERLLHIYNSDNSSYLCESTAETAFNPAGDDYVNSISGIHRLIAYCASQEEFEALREHIKANVPGNDLLGISTEAESPDRALLVHEINADKARAIVTALDRSVQSEKTQKENLQSSVKEWYSRTFPTDELASELNANATFGSVRDAIMSGKDIYTELGYSADSVVRERVFRQLADVLDLPYKSVYNAWIENSESAETRKERYERAMREDFPKDFADDFDEPTPSENRARTTQTVQLRMTAAEQQIFKDFLAGWNDGASTEKQVYDFGAERPQSADFWKGLEMLGEVERSDMSFGVRFDWQRAHSFKIENDLYENVTTPQSAQSEQRTTPPTPQHTKPLMVNFYAGPSAGKTTAALELTAALKKAGYNVEYVSEYAKELVLENRSGELADQKHVTDEQYRRFDRIRNSADIIVTDSPVLLGLVYGDGKINDEYKKQIRSYYDSFDNFNMLMTRPKDAPFQTEGRVHDESQSIELDGKIKSMLDAQGVFYGSYKRDDIAKTVERIGQTYSRLYGEQKGKAQKESAAPAKQQPAPAATFKTNLDNIPAEMKALPNWVAFRTEKLENGKIKKILLSPNKGASSVEYLKWASPTDPTTWSTFDQAAAFAKKYKLEGLSFALSGSGMTCIDLDKHLDESGKPSELAQKFIDAAQGTYIEKSVSGRGLHIFYKGARPEGYHLQNDEKKLENYDTARIITMTGNLYDGAACTLTAPSAELTNLLKSNLRPVQQHVAPSAPLGMDDNALIDKIRSSSRRADFDALWRGELILTKEDGSGDPSRCDYMLCNILGFFSGGDVAQVERLIKSSGLYRPEKPDKYYAMTARKACDGLRKVYTPTTKSNSTKKNSWKPGGNGKPNGNGSGGNSGR